MTNEKTIDGWLVVDWKKEKHRTRKSKPDASDLGTNELLAKLKVDVTVPEVDVPTLAVSIDVPEPQVFAATLEAIDEEDLPDWSDTAIDVVESHREAIADAKSQSDHRDLVDTLTTRVLMKVNTRPPPSEVRKFVDHIGRRVANGNPADPDKGNDPKPDVARSSDGDK